MKRVLTLVLLMMVSLLGHATTLESHIESKCKKGCIDEYTLLNASTQAADAYGLDFRLVLAIISIESGFVVLAKNKGNVGLTQVLLKYHRDKFVGKNYFDPYENVRVGSSILKACKDKWQSLDKQLRCYNSAPNNIYANKVLKEYSKIKQLSFI